MFNGFADRDLAVLAMNIEKQGIDLYERCLALFPRLRTKQLDEALAQEHRHYEQFAALDAELQSAGGALAPDSERRAFLSSMAADLTLPAGLMQIVAQGACDQPSDLLGQMIHAEALSMAFYAKLAGRAGKSSAIAQEILREEGEHKRWLEGLREEALEREHLLTLARNRHKYWLALCAGSPGEIALLEDIAKDEDQLFDAFWRELEFGTGGMRGVIGLGSNRMNKYNVRRATQGLAQMLLENEGMAERGVVIAYDSRRFSPEFAREAALILCANGVRAHLFPTLRPVPVLSFSVRHMNAAAGIVITASHNPKEYNGYKVYGPDGGQMALEATERLVSLINKNKLSSCVPMEEREARERGLLADVPASVDDAYIARVKELCVSPERCRRQGAEMPILYTPLNGSGNLPVRRILAEVGFTRVSLVAEQVEPDADFTTVGTPNPENPAAFALALAQAEREGQALIFGTDPDCDRLGVAVRDETGAFALLTGNQIGCLLMHYILSARRERGDLPANGAVVKSIVSTRLAAAIAEDFGVTLFDVLTGFKFIAEKIQEFEESGSHQFLFGFEESYGYLAGTFVRDKDAVIASMLLAETAAWYREQGMTLYEGLQSLYKTYGYYGERVVSVTLSGKEGADRIAEIMGNMRRVPPCFIGEYTVLATRDLLSGCRTTQSGGIETIDMPISDVLYYELEDDGWVCVRPSGTEPKIKLYLNAVTRSPEDTARTLDGLEAAMKEKMGV